MTSLLPSARHSLRRLSPRTVPSTLRRPASTSTTHPTHTIPTHEPLGKSVYLLLAALPTVYILYSFSRGTDKQSGWVKKLTDLYRAPNETYLVRNALHTRMVEQAGHDRNLFINSAPIGRWAEMKMPESINNSSPYNVSASSSTNLDALMQFHRDKHNKEEQEKLALMKEGRLPAQITARGEAKVDPTVMAAAAGEAGGKGA